MRKVREIELWPRPPNKLDRPSVTRSPGRRKKLDAKRRRTSASRKRRRPRRARRRPLSRSWRPRPRHHRGQTWPRAARPRPHVLRRGLDVGRGGGELPLLGDARGVRARHGRLGGVELGVRLAHIGVVTLVNQVFLRGDIVVKAGLGKTQTACHIGQRGRPRSLGIK